MLNITYTEKLLYGTEMRSFCITCSYVIIWVNYGVKISIFMIQYQ